MKNVIIVEDELDARLLLKQYINENAHFKIVAEASDGIEAIKKINALKPDLVFLDIQIPGKNGFEVLKELEELPQVIFSTAYDEYAIESFRFQAIDYLLKPYGKKRFEEALEKLKTYDEKIESLAQKLLEENKQFSEKVILHKGNRKLIISVNQIQFIEAFGDYCKVSLGEESLLSLQGISALESKLNPKMFVRVHRSFIVNLEQVTELRKTGRYYFMIFAHQHQVKVSESYLSAIKKMIL